jgi:hypothetical protein
MVYGLWGNDGGSWPKISTMLCLMSLWDSGFCGIWNLLMVGHVPKNFQGVLGHVSDVWKGDSSIPEIGHSN